MESASSAKAGSRDCNGNSDELPLTAELSLKDVREVGRKGVEGREGG